MARNKMLQKFYNVIKDSKENIDGITSFFELASQHNDKAYILLEPHVTSLMNHYDSLINTGQSIDALSNFLQHIFFEIEGLKYDIKAIEQFCVMMNSSDAGYNEQTIISASDLLLTQISHIQKKLDAMYSGIKKTMEI
jgi:hypothetical protein